MEPIRQRLPRARRDLRRDSGGARVLGIDRADINPSTELITSLDRELTLLDIAVRRGKDATEAVVQRMDMPKYESARALSHHRIRDEQHGWVAQARRWLVEAPQALTTEQIAEARKQAAATGLEIEVRSAQDDLATLRNGATVVGAVLALAIVAMTIGLLRGESVRDLRTLTATGAPARIRRAVTASAASVLALLGAMVSIVGAYAALIAAYSSNLNELSSPPFANLFALTIGLPLLAAVGGWLLGGREPTSFAHQSLD